MLRWILPILMVTAAGGTAFAADQLATPRPHVKARTAAGDHKTPPDPDSLISPSLPTTPILLGSATLPGYYGRPFSYEYQGPYYGEPNSNSLLPSYLLRLPYACGIYGYC
jgi:hypothetical protein